jgi:hypothetical protein
MGIVDDVLTVGMDGQSRIVQSCQVRERQAGDGKGERDQRGHGGNVVDNGRRDTGEPEQRQRREHQVAIGQVDDLAGNLVEETDLLDAADQDEEANKEEDRRPFHFGQDRMEIKPGEQEEQDGAEHRHRPRLEMQHAVEQEAQDRQCQHDQ